GLTYRLPRGNQVLHDLLLPVNHDRATRQLLKIDPVPATCKVQKDALMKQTLLHHARADARIVQDLDALVLEYSSPHAVFDVVPALGLQDYGLYPVLMKEMSQQQTGRACPDDRNLCAHER